MDISIFPDQIPAIVQHQTENGLTDPNDVCYPVRRALFIRQIMGLKENDHLEIDWGLLNALLKVKNYKHGARSLTNLLKNLKENSAGRKIQASHLPSNTILNLYLKDLNDFFDCMNENQVIFRKCLPYRTCNSSGLDE